MTKICLIWPGNHFTESFYLQTVSGSCAKERESERKRERETAQKRDRTSTQHRRRRDRSKSSDEPKKPKTELVRRAMPQSLDCEPIPQIVELVCWTQSLDREPIPQIVELVRRTHSSDREPRSSRRIADLLALGRSSSRSISSSICLLSDFGLISDLMNFFAGYWEFGFWWIWILLELMIYLFGCWENARKCEKHDKIGFFRVFSRIQPNTRKYFLENILICNQTLKNIFLS